MKISAPCIAALTWTLTDSLGEVLDTLHDPVEFLVGGNDLLAVIETALDGAQAGQTFNLAIEPEQGFGEYDEQLVCFAPRSALPQPIEEGLLIEGRSLAHADIAGLQPDAVYTVSTLYPEHAVLDANHPLAGIALRLRVQVCHVRAASADELAQGSAGVGFFRLSATTGTPSAADRAQHIHPAPAQRH